MTVYSKYVSCVKPLAAWTHIAGIHRLAGAAFLAFGILGIASGGRAAAAPQSFSDGTFSDWSIGQVQNHSTGVASATEYLSGGDPGAFLQINNHTGNSTQFYAVALDPNATWNPSVQGAISSLSGSFDQISFINGNGQGTGFALQQGSVDYVLQTLNLSYNGSYTTVSLTNLTASSFISYPGSSHPDFSASGSTITFGLTAVNCCSNRNTLTDFDNFSLTLNGTVAQAVPEPASMAVLGLGFAALLAARSRMRGQYVTRDAHGG